MMKLKPWALKREATKETSAEQWERAWRSHWEKPAFTPYELPVSDAASTLEREFLMHPRTLDSERSRLKRIMNEFEHGFRVLYKLGPADSAEEAVELVIRSLPRAIKDRLHPTEAKAV